jgi:hypothetical protein
MGRIQDRIGVSVGVKMKKRLYAHQRQPLQLRICTGRWDRNRTCNLRFWRPLEHICCLPLRMRCGLVLTEVVVSDKIVGRLVGQLLILARPH